MADKGKEDRAKTRDMIASLRMEIGEIRQAASGGEALSMLLSGKTDVVVTETCFEDMDGVSLMKRIRKFDPKIKIIVYSHRQDFDFAIQALRCRVSDYLLKPAGEIQMERALQKAETEREGAATGIAFDRVSENTRAAQRPEQGEEQRTEYQIERRTETKAYRCESQALVEKARQYIEENFSDPELSVEKLSSYLHVSKNYFSTIFKKETGETYVSYLTRLRLKRAGELLASTGDKSCVIAQMVGYPDPNYFSYLFKKNYGVSPSLYGARCRRAAAM